MDVTAVAWRTSSYSGDNGGACVEVGTTGPAVAVRDSKHPDSPPASLHRRHLGSLHRPAKGGRLTRDELLAKLAGLRQAPIEKKREPHKPLLLLWLFGQFAATGSSAASYQQAEEPVSQLINEFGPPVASPAAARQRAAMPFVHLERELWDLRDTTGNEIAPDAPERRAWLLGRGAVGRLRAPVERLLSDPATLAAAARLLLDLHFTPVLAELICAAVDLDVPALDLAGSERVSWTVRLGPGAADSPKRSCAPTPTSALCADSTVRSGIIPSRSKRPTSAGTASRAQMRWRTRWPSAPSIMRCSTWASSA